MIEIEQTNLTSDKGNCFAACLASILEIGIEDIPHTEHVGLWEEYLPFLRSLNLTLVFADADHISPFVLEHAGYYLVGAASPRFPGSLHAVVGLAGDIVWDPHPGRSQKVGDAADYMFLVPINPAENESRLLTVQQAAFVRTLKNNRSYEGNPSERL